MKKSKKAAFVSEISISSSAPLNVVMEKAKAKKRKVVKKAWPPLILVPFIEDYDSGSSEPLAKNTRIAEIALVVEPTVGDVSFALIVVRLYAEADVRQD